jgi:hypothetical protein
VPVALCGGRVVLGGRGAAPTPMPPPPRLLEELREQMTQGSQLVLTAPAAIAMMLWPLYNLIKIIFNGKKSRIKLDTFSKKISIKFSLLFYPPPAREGGIFY